ncbi:hypothetical protein CV945_11805 [Geobacillus sp. Manikaran-105]|nr:hypothetical protein CV945_11805 [Geobacillus sp. Manikaran-105]
MSTMDMQNNLFYRLILHIYWLTVCNCYFFLFCIPFLLSLFWFWNHPNTITLLLTLVSFIPIPPALTASYHVMGKIIREKQVELTKSFFYGVKTNFIQCSMLGLFQAILTIILAVDILFMKQHALGLYVIPFLYILLLLNVCVGIYLYPTRGAS